MNQETIDAAVKQLAETPMRLRDLFERMDPAKIRIKSHPTLFSPLEDVWHLHDIEREGYLKRIRRILTEELPVLENLDGDRMAIERRYIELELPAAIDGFAAARAASLALLRELPLQDWVRRAEFENRSIDLWILIGMMVEHDRGHLLSIQGVFVSSVAA
ncbi:MAG: DinB family protein [Steroidobacteraceae bacterium]